MADNLDDGEFWLPRQFLTEDDIEEPKNGDVSMSRFLSLSSPVESVVGSSETESDEEDYMAELTRRIADSTLETDYTPKGAFGSGSPQSTLSAFGSSGKGSSPNGSVSQANSQAATWNLLRAAAGEVERMCLSNERYGVIRNNNGKSSSASAGFYNQQQHSLSRQQLQIAQFQMLRQQQMSKQQQGSSVWGGGISNVQRQSNHQMVPNRGRNTNNHSNNNVRGNMGLSASAWPPLQQQYGSGMRAVFVGNPSVQRESTGTGVFLPRCINNPVESRKKPACKTVLVPDRVAQALNLKINGTVQQPRVNGSTNVENAPPQRNRSNNGFPQQKRVARPQPPVNHEIRLPQEWTY